MIQKSPNLKKLDEIQIIDDGIDCDGFVTAADQIADYIENLSEDDYKMLKYGVRIHERD